MLDRLHRVLTGQTATRVELVVAGVVVLAWIAMDVHQYVAFLFDQGCK